MDLFSNKVEVGVPGAFTPPCSSQVPGYLENAKKFADAGVKGIYIVAVNDVFCVNAWQEKLSSGSKHDIVHFVSDGTGHFTAGKSCTFLSSVLVSALGLNTDLGSHGSYV